MFQLIFDVFASGLWADLSSALLSIDVVSWEQKPK